MTSNDYTIISETTTKDFESKAIKTTTAYLYVGDDVWTPQIHVTVDCSYYDVDDLADANDDNIIFSRSFFESYDFETYDEYLDSALHL